MDAVQRHYKEGHIVPVMRYIDSFSASSVCYRTSIDQRHAVRDLAEDERECRAIANLITHEPLVELPKCTLLKLIEERGIYAGSGELEEVAQRMLLYGLLVPNMRGELRGESQRFGSAVSYFLCRDSLSRERAHRLRNNEFEEGWFIVDSENLPEDKLPRKKGLFSRTVGRLLC